MSRPDPAFLDFFAGTFRRELEDARIPGMADASWDRKAAWLLYVERRKDQPAPHAPAPTALSGGLFD